MRACMTDVMEELFNIRVVTHQKCTMYSSDQHSAIVHMILGCICMGRVTVVIHTNPVELLYTHPNCNDNYVT